ncbi:unnamed protein product [Spirodela intermedia]|uniref:Uncharacterized protein n=1 Tax=Spirodela intermedia TaxID=51605 RepID=A0A7I8JQB0_SPIIN|nr:unnamed protein product [Spirodela intermedia]CAA6671753.1 unnamed protein product [Spirodela intermedia]
MEVSTHLPPPPPPPGGCKRYSFPSLRRRSRLAPPSRDRDMREVVDDGIAVNLVTYLGDTMHLPSAESANIVTDFMGTSFLLCLLGGFLADSFLGRYRTIVIFALVQTLGTAMLSVSTKIPSLRPPPCMAGVCERANGLQMGVLYLALYTIALGTGGLKSSVSGFGTDQFDEKDEREKVQMAFFFNRFFFLISTGTLLAVTVLVYIQDEVGRSWAYAICSIAMLIAIVVFLAGTRRYRYKKNKGSPIVHILQVLLAATKKRKHPFPSNIDALYEDCSGTAKIYHTHQFRCLDKAAITVQGDYNQGAPFPNPWKLCSVTRIEEVKMMIRLLPVWATTIIFWTTYAQMITFSVEQASTMRRSIGHFEIPAGSLTVFFVGAILITLAVYDRVIMPSAGGFTDLQLIGLGLILSTAGMVAAAVSGWWRRGPLPISVFALIPQFFLVGAGEAFIYTGQLDFFLTRSPRGMKTVSTGLFLSTLSLGFFVSSILVSVVKSLTREEGGGGWLADEINQGRLDCFYGLLAGLGVVNFVAFWVCAAWYKPQRSTPKTGLQMESVTKSNSAEDGYN